KAERRRAPKLFRRGGGVVTRNAREPDEAPRIALAEVGGPAVVDLVDRLDQLLVGKPQADAEDAVHDLGVDAVDLLVLEPEGGGGGMRPAFVEAGLEHPLDVLGKSALDAVEAEAEAAVHPELLVLGEPAGPVVGLPHLRRPVAELRRPV